MQPMRQSDPVYELRAADEPRAGFTGYAATWNRVDSYRTAFAPTSFTKTLAERADDIRVLYNHDPDINFGVPNDLRIDDHGLYVDAAVIEDGADGTVFLKRLRGGARFGLSFGFRTVQDRAATEDDSLDMSQVPSADISGGIRVITEVKLYEISPVTFPANDLADIVAVRQAATADALRAVLDDLAHNRLTDAERELVRQIVAAVPIAAPAGSAPPRASGLARRLLADAALAEFDLMALEQRMTA